MYEKQTCLVSIFYQRGINIGNDKLASKKTL